MSNVINLVKPLKCHSKILDAIWLFSTSLLFFSCGEAIEENNGDVELSTVNIIDSVTITDIGTDIETIKFSGSEKVKLPMVYNTIGKFKVSKYNATYLTFLESGGNINIEALPDSSLTTNRVGDSLLNYLSTNSLDFINENLDFIFTTDNLDSIVQLFDTYKARRERQLMDYSDRLSTYELKTLRFYNGARLYGFLQFYGLVPKKLEARNTFYDFIAKIDSPGQGLRTAPYLYLNKLKIEYLREFDSLNSLPRFFNYIDMNIPDKDMSDFLKFNFIKELSESSPYWEPELELLNVGSITAILDIESENNYYNLIRKYADKFLLTQKGKKAFNFLAETSDGSILRLDEFKGKVVFIDTWATWCAPCLEERPKVLEIAKKFGDNPDMEVLMISVDNSRDRWLKFLDKNMESSVANLFVEGGMDGDFAQQFNINAIPNYILIDKQGFIVNAYIKEPSGEVEEMISKELLQ